MTDRCLLQALNSTLFSGPDFRFIGRYLQHTSHWLGRSADLKIPIHAKLFLRASLTCKVNQTDLVFGVRLVGWCMQDYQSLCAAVTMCATLANIQPDTQTDSILTSLYE